MNARVHVLNHPGTCISKYELTNLSALGLLLMSSDFADLSERLLPLVWAFMSLAPVSAMCVCVCVCVYIYIYIYTYIYIC
jgi:hypothetical protein